MLIFFALLYASLEYMNCSMFLRQIFTLSSFCLFMCYLPMLTNGYVQLQYTCYILLIKTRFSFINERLRNQCNLKNKTDIFTIESNGKNSTIDNLIALRKIHLELWDVLELTNEIFEVQNLLFLGNGFVSFTTHAYYCYDGFIKYIINDPSANLYNAITTVVWTIFKLLQLLQICLTYTLLKNEVS